MKNKSIIVIEGPVGSGKSEILIQLCNRFPESSLLITFETSADALYNERGLDQRVKCIDRPPIAPIEDPVVSDIVWDEIETVCIDYVELLKSMKFLDDIITECERRKIRLVIASQMSMTVEKLIDNLLPDKTNK